MKYLLSFFATILLSSQMLFAQAPMKKPVKKALVIGIDTYSPPIGSKQAKSTTRPPEAWNDSSS